MRPRLFAILVAVTVAVALAACSDKKDKPASTGTTATATQAATEAAKGAVLAPDGLGIVKFGDQADDVVTKLRAAFGAPSKDFVPPECAPRITRSLEWGGLHVDLGPTLVGYEYTTSGDPPLHTEAGIGQGSTVTKLKSAYGSSLAIEPGIESSQFTITLPSGRLQGYIGGSEGSDPVETLYAGTVCGE